MPPGKQSSDKGQPSACDLGVLKRVKAKKDVSSGLVGTMLHPHQTREDRAEPARIHRGQWSQIGL